MLSELKHRLANSQTRVIALLAAVVVLLYSLTGCNKSQTSNSISDSVSSTFKSTTVEESGNSQSNSQSEFDFDEAVKNIMLFGSKVSLPCAIEDLGKEFTFTDQSEWVVIGDVVNSNLYYENKKIGTVNLSESDGDKTQIIGLTLGFGLNSEIYQDEEIRKASFDSYGWYSEEIEIDFGGLNFNSSENEIKLCLGTPTETTDVYFDDYLVYKYPNGHIWVKFYQDMITEFTIEYYPD